MAKLLDKILSVHVLWIFAAIAAFCSKKQQIHLSQTSLGCLEWAVLMCVHESGEGEGCWNKILSRWKIFAVDLAWWFSQLPPIHRGVSWSSQQRFSCMQGLVLELKWALSSFWAGSFSLELRWKESGLALLSWDTPTEPCCLQTTILSWDKSL